MLLAEFVILFYLAKNKIMEEEFDTKRNLIVNYLPPKFDQDDVKALFSRVGTVTKTKLVRNNMTGESLGYAFVEYPSDELAGNAIKQLNGIEIEGKNLKVSTFLVQKICW